MSSFFPGLRSVNWSGGMSSTHSTSNRRDSHADPFARTTSSPHRSSSRYGDRSHAGIRDCRSSSGDAVVGASRYEERNNYGGGGDERAESSYSRFVRERESRERDSGARHGYESRSCSNLARHSSNYEPEYYNTARRGATVGLERDTYSSSYTSGYQHCDSSTRRSQRDSEVDATAGAERGQRSGSRASEGYSGYRRSSAEGRYPNGPNSYYRYW